MPTQNKVQMANVMPFDKFWTWLQTHPNCILNAGTPEAVLYDADDYHWHFGNEDGTLLVQVMRGKALVGEILIDPHAITYVQSERRGEEEYVFDCVAETEDEPMVAYYFTLTHDFDTPEASPAKKGRLVH